MPGRNVDIVRSAFGVFERGDLVEDFENWTYEPIEFVEARERIAVKVHQTATGAQSGVPVESDIWFAFGLREGKIARLSFHLDHDEAIEATREA